MVGSEFDKPSKVSYVKNLADLEFTSRSTSTSVVASKVFKDRTCLDFDSSVELIVTSILSAGDLLKMI